MVVNTMVGPKVLPGAAAPPVVESLTRVTKSYLFGSGDYPDKLLFHQALN